MIVKKEIRILGIDDSHFSKNSKKVLVVGAVMRAGESLDGVLSTYVKKDGLDSTQKLISLINKSRHKLQLRVIMLNGIALAGFNIVDIEKLSKKTGLPVIVIMRKRPNFKSIERALRNFDDFEKRMKLIKKAGEVNFLEWADKKIYYQSYGIDKTTCEKIIKLSATHSNVPEPIRLAHIIATGVVLGESKKRV